jgi:hypothetical protein
MDTKGARALARRIQEQKRIEEQQRIEEEKAREAMLASAGPAEAPPSPAARPNPPAASDGAARATARTPAPGRDIRMYSRDVSEVTIEGRRAVVTTVRCREFVDGEWVSRIVDVRVDEPRRSG